MAIVVDRDGNPINGNQLKPVKRVPLKNKQKEVRELSATEKAAAKARERQALKLFSEFASGSATFGQTVSGFKSIAESAKPRGKKKDPTPSQMGASVPKVATVSVPTQKSAIDTLTARSTRSDVVVDQIIADGSPKGIEKALTEAKALSPAMIKDAVNQANSAANDPVAQEKFREIGLDPMAVSALVSKIDADALTATVQPDHSNQAVTDVKDIASKQMATLDNPFGSFKSKIADPKLGIKVGDPMAQSSGTVDNLLSRFKANTGTAGGAGFGAITDVIEKNKFGAIGVDKANMMGNIAASTQGIPTIKELGVEIPGAIGGIDQTTGIDIPDIVNKGGFTQLSDVIEDGPIMNTKPSTPIQEVGAITSGAASPSPLYTKVHSVEELILDLKSVRREYHTLTVEWTGSAADRSVMPKQFNDIMKAFYEAIPEAKTLAEQKKNSPGHFFIEKDGTVTRMLPLEEFGVYPLGDQSADLQKTANNLLKYGVNVIFDAGHSVPAGEKTTSTYSPQSINEAQYNSFKMIASAFLHVNPGGRALGWDEIFGPHTGPGFNVPDYMRSLGAKIGKPYIPKRTPKVETTAAAAADRIDLAFRISRLSYDYERNKYTATRTEFGISQQFESITEAISYAYFPESRHDFAIKYNEPNVAFVKIQELGVLQGAIENNIVLPRNSNLYDEAHRQYNVNLAASSEANIAAVEDGFGGGD